MTLSKQKKQELIEQFRRSQTDTGSAEVQIALLTSRINRLSEHLQQHRKDFASRRGLLLMVSKRRRLLDYLKRHEPERYLRILDQLILRK